MYLTTVLVNKVVNYRDNEWAVVIEQADNKRTHLKMCSIGIMFEYAVYYCYDYWQIGDKSPVSCIQPVNL